MRKKKEKLIAETAYPLELKKHVAVIHSSGKITLLQRKIANALLYNAYEYLDKKDEHQIQVGILCNLIGYASNDYRTIKNALVNLLSTVIEWNLMNDKNLTEESVWNASSIIADASIKGAICTYSYSNKMRQLLYRPHIYGRLDMQVQSRFQSSYGLALYENCNRYQDIGHTPWFEIGTFRKLMGIEDYKYKIFRDFKQRVLSKAVEEVNKYSPINITPQLRRENRKVTALQFLIERKGTILPFPGENQQQEMANLLKKQFGFSQRQASAAVNKYEVNYIYDKIKLIEASSSFKNGLILNLAKYLLCALKDDYQAPKQIQVKTKKLLVEKEKLDTVTEMNQREQYRRYQDQQAISAFNNNTKDIQEQILLEFEKYLGKSIYHDLYLRDGLKNILVRDQLAKYLLLYKKDLLGSLISFHDWQKQHTSIKSV